MKVILLKDIAGFGKEFDVKNASDGYARNFLIPKGFAKIATDEAIKTLEKQKAVLEKQKEESGALLKNLAEKLSGKEFHFYPQVGKKEEVFGSVNKEEIKKVVAAAVLNHKIPISQVDIEINLKRPLKSLGEHEVEINLGRGIRTKIKAVLNQAIID